MDSSKTQNAYGTVENDPQSVEEREN